MVTARSRTLAAAPFAMAAVVVASMATGCVSASSTRVEATPATPATSATGAAAAACPAPLEPYVKVTLYMGRGSRDAGEWQAFVDDVLVRHFPDGGTMLETAGWWEGRTGTPGDNNSRMLVMLHPAADRDAFALAVQEVIAEVKERYGHRAVLWEESAICAAI